MLCQMPRSKARSASLSTARSTARSRYLLAPLSPVKCVDYCAFLSNYASYGKADLGKFISYVAFFARRGFGTMLRIEKIYFCLMFSPVDLSQ